METTKNLLEANRFIETVFSNYFKDNDGHVELRFVGQDVVSKFCRRGEVGEENWAEINQRNAACHVYLGVNPRPLSQAKKQDDIKDIVCLWADVDGKDFEGGKEEALRRVQGFPIAPSIVVDSGHGCHCYWVLAEPIIGLAGEQRFRFKRILAGLVKELGADRSRVNLDSCLRLPGTLNIKEGGPIACRILALTDQAYGLEDFERFEDAGYQEPAGLDEPLPAFGTKTLTVSLRDAAAAKADVERLQVESRTKKLILTGALLKTKAGDKTRSGRDMSIICSLAAGGYDYETIKSVFFNPFLGCSDRIMASGEADLQWDVRKGLAYIEQRSKEEAPGSRRISEIRREKGLTADEKRKAILRFVTTDLLLSENAAGRGFKDGEQDLYYFFDNEEKILMGVDGTDFYTYVRNRYSVPERDFCEIRDEIKTVINWKLREKVTPRRFAYWDPEKLVLYISDHDNGVYRLDGEKVERYMNGVDGVFFEYDPTLAPFAFDPEQKAVNYFEAFRPEAAIEVGGTKITFPSSSRLGLSLERFCRDGSLLKQFLIDRASFTEDQENPLCPEGQKFLLVIVFYSLFFESIMRDKPIACFVGQKESGKSFIATSIGKIFFGDRFESRHEPGTAEDLKTVLVRNHYVVFDNLDKHIEADVLNVLCVAATGGTVEKRKLYTDIDVVRATPHCFIAITSREPKFKRDDFVSRLMLFNTKKIDNPMPRAYLVRTLLERRSAIMTEALVNLNSVVKILRAEQDYMRLQGPDWEPPTCISRVADGSASEGPFAAGASSSCSA